MKTNLYEKVVTYQSPRGLRVDITPAQEKALKAAGKWPKDWSGAEYCSVSNGLGPRGQSEDDRREVEALLAQ